MNERVKKLRQESLDAIPRLSLERAQIVTDAYKNIRVRFQYQYLEL